MSPLQLGRRRCNLRGLQSEPASIRTIEYDDHQAGPPISMMKCNVLATIQEQQLNEFSEREKTIRVKKSDLSLTDLTPP
jgi:hypothetical protein